jgi:aldehyde dehydrogenase (NAD+)
MLGPVGVAPVDGAVGLAEHFLNLIGEEWAPARSEETFEDRNPARWSELVGAFPRSGPEDVDAAVKTARAAY